jgi:hypothetical protein
MMDLPAGGMDLLFKKDQCGGKMKDIEEKPWL